MNKSLIALYPYIILLLCAIAPSGVMAQEVLAHGEIDSLLERTLSHRLYQEPMQTEDPVLLDRIGRSSLDPLIESVLSGLAQFPKRDGVSFSAYKSLLPLATQYPALKPLATSLQLGRGLISEMPSAEIGQVYSWQYDRLSVGRDVELANLSLAPQPTYLQLKPWQPALGARLQLMRSTLLNLQRESLGLFTYGGAVMSERELLNLSSIEIPAQVLSSQSFEQRTMGQLVDEMRLQEIERRYWIPSLESSVQFSQNYVSNNWYKGGSSNLNLLMRLYGALTYTKDKIQWRTELEQKLSIYNTDKSEADPTHRFRVADDLVRLRTNFGRKISKRWYSIIDAEGRTQALRNFKGDTGNLQAAPFAPYQINVGLGVKYDYKSSSKSVYKRKFAYTMNLAPLSYTYRASMRDDIELSRHGLSRDKRSIHRIGSTLRASLQWDFNMNVMWQSRLYFNTSYTNVEAEWENTLTMRIGRYFSTRINLQLRFDDSVKPDSGWNKYLQINELLSFGFNYIL